jgi:SAM-dependent methyltransferase
VELVSDNVPEISQLKILDLGAGVGTDLLNLKTRFPNSCLFGIESNPAYCQTLAAKKIRVESFDLERTRYPFDDDMFDVIIANQIMEHTKEVFWIFQEVCRLLKPGGVFVVGVPNLASLHNRFLLAIGRVPTCIRSNSAHVRGFVASDMIRTICDGNAFLPYKRTLGSGFYPLNGRLALTMSHLFPKFSVSIFSAFIRTTEAANFVEYSQTLQTDFFDGN